MPVFDIPSSAEHCEIRYPHVDDIPEGVCERCGKNKKGGVCGYKPKKKEDVVVTSSRYYQPPQEEGQIEQLVSLPVLVVEE
jgi:hypothetical protein